MVTGDNPYGGGVLLHCRFRDFPGDVVAQGPLLQPFLMFPSLDSHCSTAWQASEARDDLLGQGIVTLFFFFMAARWPVEFPGQGSDPRHNHYLSRSCGKAESLTHCARLGIEPVFQGSRDANDPTAPQWNLQK